MSIIIAGLLVAAAACGLLELAGRRSGQVTEDLQGWLTLRPGAILFGLVATTVALALFLAWVGLFFEFPDNDVTQQRFVALGYAMAFAVGSVRLLWAGWYRKLSWRGEELRITSRLGGDQFRSLSDVCWVSRNMLLDHYTLVFEDGSKIRFLKSLRGAKQLVSAFPQF